MISNDLSGLFGGDPNSPTPASLRQGVVQAWDPDTGDNEVLVGGALLVNVPVLTSESASLAIGDVVSLATDGTKWLLLGKVTTPGDPGTVPSWSADLIALDTTVTTINTVTIPAVQADVVTAQGTADTAQSTATSAAADAAAAVADAAAAQAATIALQADLDAAEAAIDTLNDTTLPALQSDLDAAEADVAAAQADITTLTGTTIPGLTADIAAAQADVDAILPIGTTDISDDAITTPKIAAGQITAVKIAANTITAAEIAANAITASELAANAVTAGKIAAGTIVAADIASGTITATQIAANTITAAKIAAGTITAAEIQAGTITSAQLSATAIDGQTITGALFRTAASGQRLEIAPSASLTRLRGFTGSGLETNPGSLNFGSSLGTSVVSPNFGAGEARVDVTPDTGPGGTPAVILSTSAGNTFRLSSIGAAVDGDVIATLTASQTLTNKDLTASTNTYPGRMLTQNLVAACSAVVGLTTTEVDITGATVTFSTTKANARYMVTGSFYFSANTAVTGVATGKLNVDGTNQTAFANFTGSNTVPDRLNSAQNWSGTLASAGSHTLKLRGVLSLGTGVNVNPTHTTITVMVFE